MSYNHTIERLCRSWVAGWVFLIWSFVGWYHVCYNGSCDEETKLKWQVGAV